MGMIGFISGGGSSIGGGDGVLGSELFSDENGDSKWSNSSLGDFAVVEDEFFYESIYNWSTTTSGSGSAVSMNGSQQVAGHPGIIDCETGTTDAGGGGIRRGVGGAIVLGSGPIAFDAIVKIDALSTVSEEFLLTCGLGAVFSASSPASGSPGDNAVYFQYDRTTSINWIGAVKSGGTQTTASGGSSVAVDTNWTHLRFVVNAAASSIEFFVDGVSLGTAASNIPTVGLGLGFLIKKTVGTTERDAFLDYIKLTQHMTTSRFS